MKWVSDKVFLLLNCIIVFCHVTSELEEKAGVLRHCWGDGGENGGELLERGRKVRGFCVLGVEIAECLIPRKGIALC